MKKIIVIASEPRTGSNLLVEALNLYKPVRPLNEFYLQINDFYFVDGIIPPDLPHKTLIRETERAQLAEFLGVAKDDFANLITQIRARPIESLLKLHELINDNIIIKAHWFHFEELDLISKGLLDLPNVEVILLERTGRLHSYVSKLKARQYDKWHNVDTSDIKVHVDPKDFLEDQTRSLNWYKYMRSELTARNKDYLEVNYEQDLDNFNKEKFYSLVDSWLVKTGLDLEKSSYEMKYFKKQNNAPIENSIENWEELSSIINA